MPVYGDWTEAEDDGCATERISDFPLCDVDEFIRWNFASLVVVISDEIALFCFLAGHHLDEVLSIYSLCVDDEMSSVIALLQHYFVEISLAV